MVSPPPSMAPWCARPSQPRASPLTMQRPWRAREPARPCAISSAADEAAREPMIATLGRSESRPRTHSPMGGSAIDDSRPGYPGSSRAR